MAIIDRRRLPSNRLGYQSPPLRLLTAELLEYNNMRLGGHRPYWYRYCDAPAPVSWLDMLHYARRRSA